MSLFFGSECHSECDLNLILILIGVPQPDPLDLCSNWGLARDLSAQSARQCSGRERSQQKHREVTSRVELQKLNRP